MLRSPALANAPGQARPHRKEMEDKTLVCTGLICGLGGADEVPFIQRKDGAPTSFVSEDELSGKRVLQYSDCKYWCFKHAQSAGLDFRNFFVGYIADETLSTCYCTRDCPTGFISTDFPGATLGIPDNLYGGPDVFAIHDLNCESIEYPN